MRTYLIFTFFFGVLLIIAGIACFFTLDANVTLTCVRGSNIGDTCTLASVGKFYSTSQEIKLSELTGATYGSHTSFISRLGRRRGPTMYRVELQTRSGRIPLTEGTATWSEERRRMANQITSFAKGRSKSSLKIEDIDHGAGSMLGMILVVGGILVGRHSITSADD
ncbi:MAG: hypothetical protein JOZ51_07875 [Chloroflexi bacterium]|nr:hypothetical protein [Chloroflexota bacterium]